MKISTTERGFPLAEFKDTYGADCSLQVSSVFGHIWIGICRPEIHVGYPWKPVSPELIKEVLGAKELSISHRMHLSVNQVVELIPLLQKYVETGNFE